MPVLLPVSFLVGRFGPPKIDYRTKGTLILTSLVEDLVDGDLNSAMRFRWSEPPQSGGHKFPLPRSGHRSHALTHQTPRKLKASRGCSNTGWFVWVS